MLRKLLQEKQQVRSKVFAGLELRQYGSQQTTE